MVPSTPESLEVDKSSAEFRWRLEGGQGSWEFIETRRDASMFGICWAVGCCWLLDADVVWQGGSCGHVG